MSNSRNLEDAIADAKKIREIALERAKQEVLKENAKKVKEFLRMSLLEAEEGEKEKDTEEPLAGEAPPSDPTSGDDTLSMDMGAPAGNPADPNSLAAAGADQAEESPVVDAVPNTFGAGTKTCTCPDDDEKITITLDDIKESYDGEETWQFERDDMEDGPVDLDVVEEPASGLRYSFTDEDGTMFFEDEAGDIYSSDDLSPEILSRVMPQDDDLADEPFIPSMESNENLAQVFALAKEQIAGALLKQKESFEEMKENYESEIMYLQDQLATYDKLFEEIEVETKKMKVQNAILHAKVRTLEDVSLNERQKAKIIESIAKAKSEEEARNLFEAIKGSLTEATPKVAEGRLSEFNKNSGAAFMSRMNETKETTKIDPMIQHWQKLARIKK